eukprot:748015_1
MPFCDICGQTFASTQAKRQHKKAKHEPKYYECDYCSKLFNTEVGKEAHTTAVHGGAYECDYCYKRFTTKAGKEAHETAVHLNQTKQNERETALGDIIETMRKSRRSMIRGPGNLRIPDNHGHIWYCFECETPMKNHRSFNSHEAMYAHIQSKHCDWIKNALKDIKKQKEMCKINLERLQLVMNETVWRKHGKLKSKKSLRERADNYAKEKEGRRKKYKRKKPD